MVYCNGTEDCQDKFGNENIQCSRIIGLLDYRKGKEGKGVCAPKNCQINHKCLSVGDACISGVVSGNCDHDTHQCKYSMLVDKKKCDCSTIGGPNPSKPCIFPFIWNEKTFNGSTILN